MRRIAVAVASFVLLVSACGGDDDAGGSDAPGAASGWDAGALARARDLADELADNDIPCESFAEYDYAVIAADYADRLRVPAAMAACTTTGDEDVTFEMFTDDDARDEFLGEKMAAICASAERTNFAFAGLAYVEGATWFVVPDSEGTANRIADTLDGATSRLATCPD